MYKLSNMKSIEEIKAKLGEIDVFESKYGVTTLSRSMRKWCEDEEYRSREIAFRESISTYVSDNRQVNFLK